MCPNLRVTLRCPPSVGMTQSRALVFQNSSTTVSCHLTSSVHSKHLRGVWIHFNATNLVDNIRFLSEDPGLRGLREHPTRCPLKHFDARRFRFPNVKDLDITTIPEGFMNIFPSISAIASTSDTGWSMLESRVYKLREMRKSSVVRLEGVSDQ